MQDQLIPISRLIVEADFSLRTHSQFSEGKGGFRVLPTSIEWKPRSLTDQLPEGSHILGEVKQMIGLVGQIKNISEVCNQRTLLDLFNDKVVPRGLPIIAGQRIK